MERFDKIEDRLNRMNRQTSALDGDKLLVYEEKNMSLTQDSRKVWEAMDAALFPNHPYGTQTVLGTQEHLKNPSILFHGIY